MKLIIGLLILGFSLSANAFSLYGADYVFVANTDGKSCVQQIENWRSTELDIPGMVARFDSLQLEWNENTPLQLEEMIIRFDGREMIKGSHVAVVRGRELNALWTGDSNNNKVSGSTSMTPFCKFMVGGLSVVDKTQYFESTGEIILRGRYMDNGQWLSVESDLPFRFHLTPSFR